MKALLLMLAVTGCTTVGSNYTLPPQCRGDLNYVKAPIVRVLPANFPGHRQIGAYLPPSIDYPDGLIFVASSLSATDAATVVTHERCHAIAGAWHP